MTVLWEGAQCSVNSITFPISINAGVQHSELPVDYLKFADKRLV